MKRLSIAFSLAALMALAPAVCQPNLFAQDITITVKHDNDEDTKQPFKGKRPAVDVAILLDTSNSMDGLISQAKTQLWNIVQQFAEAKKSGRTPILRVAVFEFGNTNLPASEGYIRQVVQLTDDMDKVSECLFALTTNGGDEYCGTVIDQALQRLDWSSHDNAYRAIFIAGNEPFTQGSVDYKEACGKAIQKGVIVNTIHCGDYQAGVSGKWKHGAMIAEGEYMNINQDQKVVHIKAPQDKIIIELNTKLNETYLWYGAKQVREGYQQNQLAQDANIMRSSGGAGFSGGRGATKAGKLYRNVGRDLVDSMEEDSSILLKVKDEELPQCLEKLSEAERVKYVKDMAAKRAQIKKQILAASKERADYVREKQKEMAAGEVDDSFGAAISKAVRSQLEESGFEVEKK